MSGDLTVTAAYGALFTALKHNIQSAPSRAVLAVNAEQIALYHEIGRELLARREAEGWGAKVIHRLAHDLSDAFPDMRGFSARNLHYMRLLAEECAAGRFVQQAAAQLPWFHTVLLLTKLPTAELRGWYAAQAVAEGWSRTTLPSSTSSVSCTSVRVPQSRTSPPDWETPTQQGHRPSSRIPTTSTSSVWARRLKSATSRTPSFG